MDPDQIGVILGVGLIAGVVGVSTVSRIVSTLIVPSTRASLASHVLTIIGCLTDRSCAQRYTEICTNGEWGATMMASSTHTGTASAFPTLSSGILRSVCQVKRSITS